MPYTAIVISPEDQVLLKEWLYQYSPDIRDWRVYCHHLTLHMGRPLTYEVKHVDRTFQLRVQSFGLSDKAAALGVSEVIQVFPLPGKKVESLNPIPHITLAVNTVIGGKPVHSNEITNWEPLAAPFVIKGTLRYVE